MVAIIETYKATVCFTAPTAYHAMLRAMDAGADLSSLRVAVSAGETLLKHNGGMGLLLSGVPGVPPARVVVLGGGVVGVNAARMAAGLGAEVVILERSIPRMRYLDDIFAGRVVTRYSTAAAVEEEVLKADVVVGAVLTAGAAAPKLVRRERYGRPEVEATCEVLLGDPNRPGVAGRQGEREARWRRIQEVFPQSKEANPAPGPHPKG